MAEHAECYCCGKMTATDNPKAFRYCPICCDEGEGTCTECGNAFPEPTWSQRLCGGVRCLAEEQPETIPVPERQEGVAMNFLGRNGGRPRYQGRKWTVWAEGYVMPGDTVTYHTPKGRLRVKVTQIVDRRFRKFDDYHESRCYYDEFTKEWLDLEPNNKGAAQ